MIEWVDQNKKSAPDRCFVLAYYDTLRWVDSEDDVKKFDELKVEKETTLLTFHLICNLFYAKHLKRDGKYSMYVGPPKFWAIWRFPDGENFPPGFNITEWCAEFC